MSLIFMAEEQNFELLIKYKITVRSMDAHISICSKSACSFILCSTVPTDRKGLVNFKWTLPQTTQHGGFVFVSHFLCPMLDSR